MRTRCSVAVGLITLACCGAGTASAAATTPGDPPVAPDCVAFVQGATGREVLLDPHAVVEPIAGALGPLDVLGALGEPFRREWTGSPPIPVGRISDGEALISGAEIADAAVARLAGIPAVAPVLDPLVPAVRSALSSTCGIVTRGDRPDAPQPPPPPGPPEEPSSPPASDAHREAPGSLPDSAPGREGVRFGAPVTDAWPWPAPGDRVVGDLEPGAAGGGDAAVMRSQPELAAGRAEALPLEENRLPPAVLVAVLAITVVSAQLVRAWVLRSKRE